MSADDRTHRSSGEPVNPRRAAVFAGPCRSAMWLLGLAASLGAHSADANKLMPRELPFKVAKIYFETNASACDMGIQIAFDTEGIKSAEVRNPQGDVIHTVNARSGLFGIGGQTEG